MQGPPHPHTGLQTVTWLVDGADLMWLESPTNPLLQVADLAAICAAAKAGGARVAVDNTFATPLLQRPLHLGADIVMHSATKFLGRHADLLLGITVAADFRYPGLADHPGHKLAAQQMRGFGAVLAFDVADAATADGV